jgi:predicted nuclease with RNAse H fold
MWFVGIDPGASALHYAVLDDTRRVVDGGVLPAGAMPELLEVAAGAGVVAIDAPAAPSTAPHAGDPSLPPKFRPARCCEIALAHRYRLWVPWVAPVAGAAADEWMRVGFRLFQELAAAGHAPIEVYPHAGFRLLAGRALPRKTTAAGRRKRAVILAAERVAAPSMDVWTHDALDATMAALLALRAGDGTAVPVGCGHDGSAIWVPRVD